MQIEVAYAQVDFQHIEVIEVAEGTTIEQALVNVTTLKHLFPEMVIDLSAVGVFGKRMPASTKLNPNDRIEIYRPLQVDPKDARRKRAQQTDQSESE